MAHSETQSTVNVLQAARQASLHTYIYGLHEEVPQHC